MNSAGSLDDGDVEAFRNTTTVFYIQAGDADRKAEFETALRSVWTITPFIVATPDEMGQYDDGHKYSEAGFGGYIVQRTSRSGMVTTNTHLSYDFEITDYNKKGKESGRTLLARFLLSPDDRTLMQSRFMAPSRMQRREMTRTLYTTSVFSNWGPGYLRSYAKVINDALLAKTRRRIFSGLKDDALAAVARDTLFLPISLKNRYSGLTGIEREAEADDDDDDDKGAKDDMRSAYPFKAQFVDDETLQRRILTATKPVYYVTYVRSSADKHVAVFNGQTGQQLYAEYTPISYNFKAKDLRKVGKAID